MLRWEKGWRDILVFEFDYYSYLLQGKKHKRTNLKRFKVTKIESSTRAANPVSMPKQATNHQDI